MRVGAAAMYLFDTDVITNILKKRPSPTLLARLESLPQQHQFITTITISEIVYGAYKSNRPRFHLQNLEEILLPRVNVIGLDLKAGWICGRLRARLEKEGRLLPLADLEIAAIAMANDLCLVSGNTRHFSRIPGLRLENWLAE